ncbi:MAG: hypothetical protein N2D54_10665, partial [Chloroflexota bacterium]
YQLQQVDSKLDAAKARIKEIELLLNEDAALLKAQKLSISAIEILNSARGAQKIAEGEVSTQEEKIAHNQKVLYSGSVTNPKELEDLQQEAAALARYLEVLEETQLEKMVAFEGAESNNESATENLAAAKEQAAHKNEDLSNEQTELMTTVSQLKVARQEVSSGVDPSTQAEYEKLREKKNGVAVARVKDGTCTACGTKLTASRAQEARSPTIITHCNFCRRILYSG